MRRRSPRWLGPIGLALALGAVPPGCGGNDPPSASPDRAGGGGEADRGGNDPFRGLGPDAVKQGVLLDNVVSLLERAPLTPGGKNIDIAGDNLNQYFRGTTDAEFRLSDEARSFLSAGLADSPFRVEEFESRAFGQKDTRHIEDCLLYHNIASRVAGPGTMLDRVRRLFDWSVRHVLLVPPEATIPEQLVAQGLDPVPARPYDVIVRGFGSELPGEPWADRSWVFLALCRQIGVDAAMLGYFADGREEPTYWACAALVDGVPYLFDARIGMEIPGPDGGGIATLEQAATDPTVLDRLDLPEPSIPYATSAADLARVRVYLDSSRGYFAPKMGLLQKDLAASNRMVIHRDPAEQRDAWASALGDRLDAVELWELPLTVEYRLFTDPSYVGAIQYTNFYFSPDFPLLGARLRQLRGDLAEAKQDYIRFRFRQVLQVAGEAVQMPPEVRQEIHESLDLFATYYLALAQLEGGMTDQAIHLFEQAMALPPRDAKAVRGRPATLLRLGAEANLGLLYDERGDAGRAIHYYSQSNTTPQSHGNLLRANALIFADPFGPPPPPPSSVVPDSETPDLSAESESEAGAEVPPAADPAAEAP